MNDEFDTQVSGIGALAEPSRRALYRYVASQPAAVGREQVAEGVHLPLHSVKFHLDRLVEEGLLDVEFRRLSDRTGPGAGRPAKLYHRSTRQLSVSLPERRYDLAGEVLAEAIDRSMRDDIALGDAVQDAALTEGRRLAAEASVKGTETERAVSVLGRHGYEPRGSAEEIVLNNCPFDRLVHRHTELVCTMNLSLVHGVLDGLGCAGLEAVLAPQPGQCCVKARRRR